MSLALHRALPAHVRAPAQELLDLAFVTVRLPLIAPQRAHAHGLRMLEDGLAAREAEVVAGALELAVIQPAPVAQLVEDLGRQADAREPQRRRAQRRAPGRYDGHQRAAEQRRDLR